MIRLVLTSILLAWVQVSMAQEVDTTDVGYQIGYQVVNVAHYLLYGGFLFFLVRAIYKKSKEAKEAKKKL